MMNMTRQSLEMHLNVFFIDILLMCCDPSVTRSVFIGCTGMSRRLEQFCATESKRKIQAFHNFGAGRGVARTPFLLDSPNNPTAYAQRVFA